MTPQERDIIGGIFDRVRQAETTYREPEAERYIAERLKAQPYATYVMAQSIYSMEQALNGQQAELEQLRRENEELRNRPAPQAQPQQGGFLSGLFGGGAASVAQPQPQHRPAGNPWGQPAPQQQQMQPQQQMSPWGGQQQQQAAPSRAGGFMATAATAAVGVAGGMLMANAISGMMKPNSPTSNATGNSEQTAGESGAWGNPSGGQQASNNQDSFFGGNGNESNYSDNSGGGWGGDSGGFGDGDGGE